MERNPANMHGIAIDMGSGLAALIREARGADAGEDDLFTFKRMVTQHLSPHASTLLVDAQYGEALLPYIDPSCLPMLAYEADVYQISQQDKVTPFPDHLTLADYARLGIRYLKYFSYYAPRGNPPLNLRKQQIVRDLGLACTAAGITFLFEPLVYDEEITDTSSLEYARLKPELVRATTAQFADPSFEIGVLKVEVPINLAFVAGFGLNDQTRDEALVAFRAAGDAAGETPLVYLSAGMSFDWFRAALGLAQEAGIRPLGFMCGRAVWADAVGAFGQGGPDRLADWLAGEGVKRLQQLKAVL